MSELGSVAVAKDSGDATLPPAAGAVSVRRAVWTLLAVAAAIILIDVATKEWATNVLEDHDPTRLLGGALYLSFTRNGGAAWSIGSNYTFVFPIVALGVAVWIGWTARRLRSLPWAIALGMVLGGAMGNMVDRVLRSPGGISGHVIDFFSLFAPYGERFPIFNIADMALSFGVVLAILLEFTGRMRDGSRLPKRDAAKEDSADSAKDSVRDEPAEKEKQ